MTLMDDKAAATQAVVDFLEKKSKTKTKFYIKDFYAVFPEDKPRKVKNFINDLVKQSVLEFWSSGSTTMYGLKGAGKQHSSEGEE